jgi:triphosphoribosyl-dephospho-CoA synthase
MIAAPMTLGNENPVWKVVSIPGIGSTIGQMAARTAEVAVRALLREAEAGPKPGLVDRFGPGAHRDMDISHFRLSAAALGPFFEAIALHSAIAARERRRTGRGTAAAGADIPATLAAELRSLGLKAEAAMLAATGGVNTHKGAIWTLGLLCAAVGLSRGIKAREAADAGTASAADSLADTSGSISAAELCSQAARIAQAILSSGLEASPIVTKGMAARQEHGLRSARDEALNGFPSIMPVALPLAKSLRDSALPEDEKVISVLLAVMCEADDTCIVARGGLPALHSAKAAARLVLDSGGPFSGIGGDLYRKMIEDFNSAGLSPGGSADLCAASLFLADVESHRGGGLTACERFN